MAESIKISELDELVSGSVIGTTKVPVVDGGATKYTQASSIKAYINSDVATDAELSARIATVNSTIDGLTTADISENASYLYYTDTRVTNRLNALSVLSGSSTSLTVTDGSTTRNAVDKITFSGATVTNDVGAGDVTVTIESTPSLTVGNGEGIPISNVDKIDFTGATITDNGNGDVTVVISGGTSTNISALNTFTGSANTSINSINTFTGSIRSEINGIEAFTASFSSSVQTRLVSLEAGGAITLPNGVVSSSAQIDYNSIQNAPTILPPTELPTFIQGNNITITSSSINNTVTINSSGGGGLPTESGYLVISQSFVGDEPGISNILLSSLYTNKTKTQTFTQFSQSVDSRLGAGGGSDYISNVAFANNTLTFTGVGSAFNDSVILPNGLVSSSVQLIGLGLLTSTDVNTEYIANRLPNGLVSGSSQISNFGFLNNASGVVSSSAQIVLLNAQSGGFDTSHVSENENYQYYSNAKVQGVINGLGLISSSILPSGSVSSSSQIDYQLVYNKVQFQTGSNNVTITSGSPEVPGGYGSPWVRIGVNAPSQTDFTAVSDIVYSSGLLSGSAQLSNLGFLSNASLTPLNNWTGSSGGFGLISQSINLRINSVSSSIGGASSLPNGVVSASAQVDYNFVRNAPTFAPGDGILISQSLENAITITANGAAPTWDSISLKPYNIVSSSVQVSEYNTFVNNNVTSSMTVGKATNVVGDTNGILFNNGTDTTTTSADLTWDGNTFQVNGPITLTSGSITMPERPAFKVIGNGGSLRASLSGVGLILSGSLLQEPVFNQGNHFNLATGIFTAPIDGLYQINLTVRTDTNTNNTINQFIVYKSGSLTGGNVSEIMIEYGTNTSMNHVGGSTITKLVAGDTLKVALTVGSGSFDLNDNFSVAYIG